MTTPAAPTREIIVRSFEPGCVRAAAHKGRYAGRTEHAGLGDTAVAPNEIIGKSDLMNQVSQGITSLRFQIANLRKVLGDGKNGVRYIATTSGRGYCFVASILRGEQRQPARMNFQRLPASRRALRHHCRVRRRPTAVAIGASAEEQSLSSSVAKERSDDQHAERD